MAKLDTLVDDFEDGTINTTIWTTATAVAETGGYAVITAGSTGLLRTASTWDPVDSEVYADIDVSLLTGDGIMRLTDDTTTAYAAFNVTRGGGLLMREYTGTTFSDVSLTYNAFTMRYVRLKYATATGWEWATSPDGTTWTVRRTKTPANAPDTTLKLQFLTASAATGSFRIGGVNAIGTPPTPPPTIKLATLVDDFADGTLNTTLWTTRTNSTESGGYAVIAASGLLQSAANWDPIDSEATIEFDTSALVGDGIARLLNPANNNYISFNVTVGGSLLMREYDGTSFLDTSTTYDAVSMRYLRFRHTTASGWQWATSPDDATWTVRRTKTPANAPGTTMRLLFLPGATATGSLKIGGVNTVGFVPIVTVQVVPDADLATTGWTTTPLWSKLSDINDSTFITATIA